MEPSAPPAAAGCSGTPLARKLGIVAPMQVAALGAPAEYGSWLGALPPGTRVTSRVTPRSDLVHLFATDRSRLAAQLTRLRSTLPDTTPVWVSWPKMSSGVPSTVTEDVVRDIALPLGFVDVKVCAVSPVWSGLRLVVRRALRKAPAGPHGP